MRRGLWRHSRVLLLTALLSVCSVGTAFAQTSSSSNYKMTEGQFGAGATSEACSGQYCSRTSIGDMAVGGSSSTSNQANFGKITDSEPLLEVIVGAGPSNLGVLTTEQTATKTATVQVRNYLSSGYVLQITGSPPKYANHTLATPSTPTESDPGTEQFGINAVANTDPSVGAGPVQVPSDQFSFGTVDPDYSTPNRFMYSTEDVVARSTKSSGQTNYTISMIINISNTTPAGHYTGDFAAVVIPVY